MASGKHCTGSVKSRGKEVEDEIEGQRQCCSKKKAEVEGGRLRRRGKGAELEAKGEVEAEVHAEVEVEVEAEGLREGGSGRGAVGERLWGKDRGAKEE